MVLNLCTLPYDAFIYTKFCENTFVSQRGSKVLSRHDCLMVLYISISICTKFCENILQGFELLSGHDFHSEIFKGV